MITCTYWLMLWLILLATLEDLDEMMLYLILLDTNAWILLVKYT